MLFVVSSGLLLSVVRRGAEPGAGEDLEAEVAASFSPLVVLLGQDGADQADNGVTVGEDADDVGAAADLAVEKEDHAAVFKHHAPGLDLTRRRERACPWVAYSAG